MTAANTRQSDHEIDPLFLERWSPRAFTGEALPESELMRLFEAARWAPSCYNSQPWRFVYALRGGPHWERFLGLLAEFNRLWAKQASALVFVASRRTLLPPGASERIPSPSHSFDCGAAWGALGLQAVRMGLQAHGMAGFDRERTRVELGVPDDHQLEAAIAIGRPGDKAMLPEKLQAREHPSGREPLSATVFEGGFPATAP